MARSRIIAGKAVIIIEAQDLVNRTLGKVRNNLHKFSNEIGKIGEGLFRTGFFGAIGSGVVINSFVKFDDAMKTLRVNLDLFGKSAREVDAVLTPLEARIRSLAQATPFSPTQVAQAATELAKGGFNPKQISDSLQAVLDLARATNTELGFSAEFIVRTLTTYGIATDKAAEVVSQLVRASRKGTLGIEDLEAAMRYSSGTADTLGVSLQKMLAVFTVLSNRGLVGSIAGTSTNTAFSQLVKKAQELKDIGAIDLVTGIREDGKEALDVISSMEALFKYAETLPFVKQQTLFQDVFNLRGARSVSAIRHEIENIKQLTGFIADAGDEARVAAEIMDSGLGGSLRRLLSTVQELGVVLGKTVEVPLMRITAVVKGLIVELNKVIAANPALASLVVLSPGILLAAGVGMIALAKGLRLAAYSAGALKGALGPIGRLLAKGTVGQISALSSTAKNVANSKSPFTLSSLGPRISGLGGNDNGLIKAQNQRNTALAVQRTAKAESLLAAAERNRASSTTKLADSRNKVNKSLSSQKAVLDQNTRSLQANLVAQRNNVDNLRRRESFQKSINNLHKEDYAIQQRLSQTRTLRDPRGGLREVPNLATAELKKLTADRERIAHQIFRLKQEQTKLGVVSSASLELRQKGLLAERAKALQRVASLEKTATSLTKGKTVIEGRYVKQLTKGQDLLIASAKAQQSIQGITKATYGSKVANIGAQGARIGIVFTNAGKAMANFGKTILVVLNGLRKFVFTTGGLLTIIQVLLLFGDKIPIVSGILKGFGTGFSNAFKEIGRIATFAAGPLALLKASIEAFIADRSDLGVQGLISAFSALASIIGNQLYAAWNRFKEGIAPVYDFVVGLFKIITVTIESIVNSIATVIGSVSGVVGKYLEIFTAGGGSSDGFLKGIATVAEGIAKLIPALFSWIASFAITFESVTSAFLVRLEYVMNRVFPFLKVNTPERLRDAQLAEIRSVEKEKLDANKEQLVTTLKTIDDAFAASSAKASGRNALGATTNSRNISQAAFAEAGLILQEIRKQVAQTANAPSAFPQGITPENNPINRPSVQAMKYLADALVGSAQSTSKNLLRTGKAVEEKQLEEQQKSNEYLRKIAEDRGIQFAP